MNRAIKYRLYPNNEQRRILNKTFGSVRFVYNHVLEEQIRLYNESLDLKSISSCKTKYKLGKQTCDNGYGMFLTLLEYKLNERGKKLVKVDKWYPSSQTCCKCGKLHKNMKDIKIRVFNCECGNSLDRDVNAAINILNEGLLYLNKKAALKTA